MMCDNIRLPLMRVENVYQMVIGSKSVCVPMICTSKSVCVPMICTSIRNTCSQHTELQCQCVKTPTEFDSEQLAVYITH